MPSSSSTSPSCLKPLLHHLTMAKTHHSYQETTQPNESKWEGKHTRVHYNNTTSSISYPTYIIHLEMKNDQIIFKQGKSVTQLSYIIVIQACQHTLIQHTSISLFRIINNWTKIKSNQIGPMQKLKQTREHTQAHYPSSIHQVYHIYKETQIVTNF